MEDKKTALVYRTEDGKIYRVKDLVLAISPMMAREGYIQPFCVFLDIGFFHNDELLKNAYQHFFIDNANKFTNSIPYKEFKNDELDQWNDKHGDGVEV